jgi:hypothetical protein
MPNPDFREMLSCLKDEGVEFVVVGAYALAAHGLPRATGDIDIRVRNSRENAHRVMSALSKFGAPTSELSEDLIKNKRAAGREKDRGDVAWLEKTPAGED